MASRRSLGFTWDANGNLTSDGVRSYTYDDANRLTQVTEGSLTTQFAYNGDGVRTSKTVAGDTTEYVLDLAATLPVVISDTEAVYLYGLDIIAQQQSDRLYYVHDGLGSVRQLVDTTGQIEANYVYDPFGVPVMGGEVYNPYQFTGEAWDAEVRLLYLRARYYQPEVGRFVTKDPWAGDVWRPNTLNRYSYARSNPVSRTDPGGLNGYGPDSRCPECHEALPGYSVLRAGGYAWFEVVSWFHQLSPEKDRHFGFEHALTQAVMRSTAAGQFRAAWSGRLFPVPWSWKHSIDVRKGSLAPRVAGGLMAYAREHVRYALTADPVGVVFGSFNEISVSEGRPGFVAFLVHNVMGRRSFMRFPGTERSPFHNVPLEVSTWGGTVEQFFHWEEPMPAVCRLRLAWEGPTRPEPQASISEY
jgi:RHS repeat-associated protein